MGFPPHESPSGNVPIRDSPSLYESNPHRGGIQRYVRGGFCRFRPQDREHVSHKVFSICLAEPGSLGVKVGAPNGQVIDACPPRQLIRLVVMPNWSTVVLCN